MSTREYSTISPSAKALLFLKGHTTIPFVRKAAELAARPETYVPDFEKKDFVFWARVLHFESRYRSIDQLLTDIPHHNILELSSGFSFRGLAMVQQDPDIHYMDTDLPDLITTKKELIEELSPGSINDSHLEIRPLNAMDDAAFMETINAFPEGEIVVVNEGLLPYLGTAEKEQLCATLRNALEKRGGYWITADIYLKPGDNVPRLQANDQLSSFFEQHRIYENMFDSFEQAAAFFDANGFVIDKEALPDASKLSALPYFLASATPEQQASFGKNGRIQATWRLRLKN